jgi:uncharacterized Tic20 family protein
MTAAVGVRGRPILTVIGAGRLGSRSLLVHSRCIEADPPPARLADPMRSWDDDGHERMGHRSPIVWSDRLLAATIHAAFVLCLIGGAFLRQWPSPILLVPLLGAWAIKQTLGTKCPFASEHARQSINLQLSLQFTVLVLLFGLLLGPLWIIPFAMFAVFAVGFLASLVQSSIAAWHAASGHGYRLPLGFGFIR